MSPPVTLPQLDGRVLSTLNADGTRRWMTPRQARGRFWRARCVVAWGLIALFTVLPWVRVGGKPPLLLDVMTRQFTVAGVTYRPTDTLLLALLVLAVFMTVFLATALAGRVWCGWACPQTVYLEFVYRPLERLLLGSAYGRRGAHASPWRRLALYAIFLVLSAHLANTFLAYFVGTDRLVQWTLQNPAAHPVAFAVFAATVGLMMFDFVFFREQLCTLVCPYGRMQGVLLDRDSLVIGYDARRGEPRSGGARRRDMEARGERAGDCVDCSLCVQVCPTGIDIRDGLQLECINCAQCIDACDHVMDKVGRPRGLIRYSSQRALEGHGRRLLRARVVIYPLLLGALVTALVVLAVRREPALIEQVRVVGANVAEQPDGQVHTPIRLLVENRTNQTRTYTVTGVGDVTVVGGPVQGVVEAGQPGTLDLTVSCPRESFGRSSRHGELLVDDGAGFSKRLEIAIAGPFGGARRKESP